MSIYLLYKSTYLMKKKNILWKKIEMFNSLIMIIFILFQTPIFPCPIMHDSGRYYFSAEECLWEQKKNKGFFFIKKISDKKETVNLNVMYAIYIIICHTIGVDKISEEYFSFYSKIFFMITFFFVGLMQRKIWNHPYVNAYINPYLDREEKNFMSRAIKYIENEHLKRNWAYQTSIVQREVFFKF